MAEVLRASFRDGDLIARLGGDEFVVLAEHFSTDAQATIRGRIERRIAQFNDSSRAGWKMGLSVGFVEVPVGDPGQLDALLAAADALLYDDKRRRKAAAQGASS